MAYSKPKTVAKSAKKASYSAGCPSSSYGGNDACRQCDRVK